MDAHFVPNLTFGAKTIKHLRRRTELPFDAHLMVDEPGRYLDEYLEAGCDSITFHVEIDEEIAPTLRRIRAAGRAAGLAVKPATPLSALEPYRELLDIVLVMTVEPGFGGQSFMKDVASDKLLAARDLLSHKAFGGEVHVDGGINRETAEFAGGLGVDILVVGSALFIKGHDMGREIRLIRALADEGYQYTLNDGVPPIPRDLMVTFTSLPMHIAGPFMDEIEAGGVPVVMLRGDGQMNPDGVRDYDLLVPASTEAIVRRAARGRPTRLRTRRRGLARGVHRRARGHPAAQPPVRALLQRTTGASVRVDGEVVGEIGAGLVDPAGRRSGRHRDDRRRPRAQDRRAADLPRRRGPDQPVAARRRRGRARRVAVHAVRRHAPRAPAGVHGRGAARARRAALPAVRRCAPAARRRRWRPAGSVPRWRSSSSTTARSRSGSTRDEPEARWRSPTRSGDSAAAAGRRRMAGSRSSRSRGPGSSSTRPRRTSSGCRSSAGRTRRSAAAREAIEVGARGRPGRVAAGRSDRQGTATAPTRSGDTTSKQGAPRSPAPEPSHAPAEPPAPPERDVDPRPPAGRSTQGDRADRPTRGAGHRRRRGDRPSRDVGGSPRSPAWRRASTRAVATATSAHDAVAAAIDVIRQARIRARRLVAPRRRPWSPIEKIDPA